MQFSIKIKSKVGNLILDADPPGFFNLSGLGVELSPKSPCHFEGSFPDFSSGLRREIPQESGSRSGDLSLRSR